MSKLQKRASTGMVASLAAKAALAGIILGAHEYDWSLPGEAIVNTTEAALYCVSSDDSGSSDSSDSGNGDDSGDDG